MIHSFKLLPVLALTILLMACGSNTNETKTEQTTETAQTTTVADDSEAEGKALVADDVAAPAGFTFERKPFEELGSMELPSGKEWTLTDNTYYNETLDMTVKIQTQNDGHLDMVKEYTEDYYKNNLRDAKEYRETSRKFGKISGYTGAIMAGTFNNGQPYVTKDFLYFTPKQCTVLQVRVNEKDADKLEPVADYMVSSLKK